MWLGDVLIDRWIPSALDPYTDTFALSEISCQIAGVVVALAVFVLGVWFLATFLQGDLSARFFAKAALLLFVAGGIFWFYLRTIRSAHPSPQVNRLFGAAAIATALVFVVAGFLATGSPYSARERAGDEARVDRLRTVASEIANLYREKHGLPSDVRDVHAADLKDPITGRPIAYQPLDDRHYRLCTTFATGKRSPSTDDTTWDHGAGRQCITLNAAAP